MLLVVKDGDGELLEREMDGFDTVSDGVYSEEDTVSETESEPSTSQKIT
jgi:hypothetical protein